jgi:hypothetical protein
MKKAKAARVPILENAFELNLPKLMRAVKATGDSRVVLNDGVTRTVAVLAETCLAVLLGGQQWVVDIVPVQCLQGRLRPLLKCPRAHEGNFQSLYFQGDALACKHCHALRYRSNLAATSSARRHLAYFKQIEKLTTNTESGLPSRAPRAWRSRFLKELALVSSLSLARHKELKGRNS